MINPKFYMVIVLVASAALAAYAIVFSQRADKLTEAVSYWRNVAQTQEGLLRKKDTRIAHLKERVCKPTENFEKE